MSIIPSFPADRNPDRPQPLDQDGGSRLFLGDVAIVLPAALAPTTRLETPARPQARPRPRSAARPSPDVLRAAIREYHAAVAASALIAREHPETEELNDPAWLDAIEREGQANGTLVHLLRAAVRPATRPARDWDGTPLPVAAVQFEGLLYLPSPEGFRIVDVRSVTDLDRP